jgi:16S rRNA (uracil1498-N3)-methyltransferase
VQDIEQDSRTLSLDRELIHYVRDVLRLGHGDELVLFDGSGHEYTANISETSPRSVCLEISGQRAGLEEPPVRLILGLGLLKAQKMDLVVQKCVELGVHRVIPLISERAVSSPDLQRGLEKLNRWKKIAREASRQCGRCRLAEISPVVSLDEFLAEAAVADLRLLFTVREAGSLDRIQRREDERPQQVFFLTGPEGGFSRQEEERATGKGFVPVGLGPRTLRAETAAILAAGLLQYRFGDLGGQGRT